MNMLRIPRSFVVLLLAAVAAASAAEQRRDDFNSDPAWDGLNNRPAPNSTRIVTQDFGYSATTHCGKDAGEAGGTISPDGKAAYYAKPIPTRTLQDAFSASGTLTVNKGGGNTLLGFFNHNTINEWRTPNAIVFRINGRGDFFHVHVEYTTNRWRAGAGVIGRLDLKADRIYPKENPSAGAHTWSIAYDPAGNDGGGSIRATFDDESAVCNLDAGHKADGASFDRFGLLNVIKSADSPSELWIDDVAIDGQKESFASEPAWEGYRNRLTYESEDVRPRFNFGYSQTNHSGQGAPGEIGGLFYRGDCRYPDRLAYYGARLETLTLKKPLHASGKVTFCQGVTDSTTLFGFFHSERSVAVNPSQASATPKDFLGFAIEGPSREGFLFYPVYRIDNGEEANAVQANPPHIFPDGTTRTWALDYDPTAARIILSLDGEHVELPIPQEHVSAGAQFNRFGFVTPWIDGNGQVVYLDDLEYTCKH